MSDADKTVAVDIIGKETVSKASSDAGGSLDRLASKVEGLSGKLDHLGSVGQTATYAVGNALGNAISGLANMAKQGVMAGLKTAASMEQAQISFTTLEKSASKAQGTIKELTDFANATPFDTQNVIDYGKQLLGAGLSADHITKTLTALGDASGALGLTQDDTSRIMLAWTQIMNRGKVQAGDLLQITEAGIPIWSVMSKALHKPVSALQDMAQKGTLVAKDVLPALEAQMEHDYGGAMAKQSQTLTGLWSTFTSTINTDMASVLKPFEGYLKTGLTKAITGVGVAMTWLQTKGVPAAIHFAKAVRDNIGLITRLSTAVTGAVVAFKGLDLAKSGIGALIALAPEAGLIVGIVVALGAGLAYAYTASAGFREWVNGVAQSAFATLQSAVQTLVGYWQGSLFPALKAVGQDLLPKLASVWQTLVQNFGQGTPIFNAVGAAFKILGSFISNLVVPWIGFLAGQLLDRLNPALKAIGFILNNVVIPILKGFVTIFTGVLKTILNAAATAFGWIPGIGPQLKAAADHFSTFASDVNSALNSINDRTVTVTAVYDVRTGTPGSGRDEGGGDRSSITGGSGNGEGAVHGSTSSGTRGVRGGGNGGASNVSYLMSYLQNQGFTKHAAAGVIGTLQGESGVGLNPHLTGDHGTSYGIAQWHNSRWNNLVAFAKKHGLSWTDMSTQVQFMMSELSGGAAGESLSKLKKMNLNDVVATMVRNFERPADVAGNITRRTTLAEQVLSGGVSGAGTGYEGIADAGASTSSSARQKRQAAAAFRAAHYVSTGGGFWKNLLKSASSLDSAFTTLSNSVGASGNKHAAAIVAAGKTQLLALAKTHDSIIAKLKNAQTALKDLQKNAAQLVQQTRDAIVQSASVAAQDQDYSYGAVIDRLQRGVAFAKEFASVMAALKARGLNSDAIQQLAALSPEQGYEQAVSILQAGTGGIKQINQLQGQLGKAGQSLGQTASDSMYAAGLKAADGLVKGLQAQQKTLEHTMTVLGQTMAKALKKALGIRSPSRVFAEIGEHTGAGLIVGLQASQGVVARAAADLLTVPARTSRGVAVAGGRTIVIEQHFHGNVIDKREVARLAAEGAKQGAARGYRVA